jgi:hypothetical protein
MAQPDPSAKYAELSRHYIRQAEEEFQKGDLAQASEKAWGAAALATKSIAAQRGWRHNSHDLLYAISDQIADELDHPDIELLFRGASSLHTNFYENWFSHEVVESGLQDVQRFLDKLEALEEK